MAYVSPKERCRHIFGFSKTSTNTICTIYIVKKIKIKILQPVEVHVKSILRIVCKHIINVRNALLKHVTKTVNYVVIHCGVRPFKQFCTIFVIRIFSTGLNHDSMTQSSHRALVIRCVWLEEALQTDRCVTSKYSESCREQTLLMLSNRSRGTLMSYTGHSAALLQVKHT